MAAPRKPQAALIAYERYATTPWQWRYETDATEFGLALHRIGELYTQQGDKEKAAAAYDQVARLCPYCVIRQAPLPSYGKPI